MLVEVKNWVVVTLGTFIVERDVVSSSTVQLWYMYSVKVKYGICTDGIESINRLQYVMK